MEDEAPPQENTFPGFPYPMPKGDLRFPHPWFDEIISQIKNFAEMKVVLYVYRHTCGYHKPFQAVVLSTDDFMNGRMKLNGERMDRGTGMSEMSVRNGIKRAEQDGYMIVETDERDKARIRKSYRLNFDISVEVQSLDPESETEVQNLGAEVQDLDLGPQTLDPRGTNSRDRTNKDREKISQKDNGKDTAPEPPKRLASIDRLATRVSSQLKDVDHEEENKEQLWEIYLRARKKGISEEDFRSRAESVLKETKEIGRESLISWGHESQMEYFFWFLCAHKLYVPFKQLVHS